MTRKILDINQFRIRPNHIWDQQWLLLTSGDFSQKRFNTMTVGWGSMGSMWNRPFVQVVVRPSRYTYQFMEHYDTFTLCAFPEKYRDALSLLGKMSGREGDKIQLSGLTPIASSTISAPGFEEAELIIECRKIYGVDLNPTDFLDPSILDHYPENNFHRIYYGEILAVAGEEQYND